METLFAFDKRNYLDCQNTFRGASKQEYYLGDYSIEAGSVIDVRAHRKTVGSCSIIRLRSRTRLSFKRSWSHIREDATDVRVLWFVKRGRLCISHAGAHSVADAGDFAITQSTAPFSIECQVDDESVHEVLHVIVPAHEFRRFLPQDAKAGVLTIPAGEREFVIAERLFAEVFEGPAGLAEHTERLLVDCALGVLGEAMKARAGCAPARQSLSARRLQDVLRFIDIHLSDPRLSVSLVASGCGISPRYLSFLLQLNGTPFSELIWDKRLETARCWLESSRAPELSISEIAYRVGFKSPAHFSRMFKRVHGKGPREYRACGVADVRAPPAPAALLPAAPACGLTRAQAA